MILIESSPWIAFLRDTGSPVCQRIEDLLAGRDLEALAQASTLQLDQH